MKLRGFWPSNAASCSPSSNRRIHNKMNITELIEELELDAQMANEMENARPEDGRLQMEAAGMLRKMAAALKPFADAAAGVDKSSADQKRLIASEISADASPGWSIRRKHLDAAREILGGNY